MFKIQGLARTIVEVALFLFALLQGAAAYFSILDRHRASKLAESGGLAAPRRSIPFLPTALASGALLAIVLGFWLIIYPRTQSQLVAPALTQPEVTSKALSAKIASPPAKQELVRRRTPVAAANQPHPETGVLVPPSNLQTAPNYQQQCVGSACAQGSGAQATFNQFGARKYSITEVQKEVIRQGMLPFAGSAVTIMTVGSETDTWEYARQLAGALKAANLNVAETSSLMSDDPSGISAYFSDDMAPLANSLAASMRKAGLISEPIQARKADAPKTFRLTVSTER